VRPAACVQHWLGKALPNAVTDPRLLNKVPVIPAQGAVIKSLVGCCEGSFFSLQIGFIAIPWRGLGDTR
jgi:hypothetical protein